MAKNRSVGPSPTRATTLREWLQTGAFVVGALVAGYQFYLKDVLKPTLEPTALDLVARLEWVGEKDRNVLVRAVITARNPTQRRIYIPAYWFTVRGIRLNGKPVLSDKEFSESMEVMKDMVTTRFLAKPTIEVIAQRRIVEESGAWWEPSDKTNDEAIFAVPQGRFDYLELRVSYLHTRDISVLDSPAWSVDEQGSLDAQFQLKFSDSSSPTLLDYSNPSHAEWADDSGAGFNWYVTTLSLWPIQGR